ncbi:hypothetical protein C8D77_105358 [Mesorhizobium loti]|uniref:Uncharacterized protein n=1 Tax=Rhizobium loti TaxID=381 RepID=A0A8E2WB41_RHILI|nr:hypothetical protein C8D77_105358 [Mesorhizobium loti]
MRPAVLMQPRALDGTTTMNAVTAIRAAATRQLELTTLMPCPNDDLLVDDLPANDLPANQLPARDA